MTRLARFYAGVISLLLTCALTPTLATEASTLFVNAATGDNQAGANNCQSDAPPCKTITHALTQAVASDTISVAAGTYNLTLGETFPLTINTNLTLTGAGAGSTILDATGANQRVITINSGVSTTTIAGVTITGGHVSVNCSAPYQIVCSAVAGVFFYGDPFFSRSVTLTNVTLSGNTATCTASGYADCGAFGGGFLLAVPAATLTNVTVSGNMATCTGASITASCGAFGGFFFGDTAATLTNVTVSGNTATCTGGVECGTYFGGSFPSAGGLSLALTDTVSLANVTVNSNTTNCADSQKCFGAGLYLRSVFIATLTNVTVSGNTANCGNRCASSGGGGVVVERSGLTLTNSTVSGNTASCSISGTNSWCSVGGGGIKSVGSGLTLTNSTVSGNTASCSISGTNSTCSAEGGGMEVVDSGIGSSSYLTVMNSTISGNTTSCNNSGGKSCTAIGGGFSKSSFQQAAVFTNATISSNTVTCSGIGCIAQAGGLSNHHFATIGVAGPVTLLNTIVAQQVAGSDCAVGTKSPLLPPDEDAGTFISNGFNLDSDNTCQLTQPSDHPGVSNPLLGPLQNNGGPTLTHALLPDSPAIDAGANSGCPATDQRGVARPQGVSCDIGAFEFGVIVAAVQLNGSAFHDGQEINYEASLNPGSTPTQVDIYLGVLLPDGVTFLSFVPGPGSTIAFAFGPVPVPFAANVTLTTTVVPFAYTFTGTEPIGTYFTYAGLAVAGSDPLQAANQLSVGVQAFQFSP